MSFKMKIELSEEAKQILAEFQANGTLAAASSIYSQPVPPARWWQAVSKGAKSGEPFFHAVKEIIFAQLDDPTLPNWPPGMYEVEESLPPLSQDEAIAILDRFLRAEVGRTVAGVQLHILHWDVLASHYCPLRERYEVLKQFAAVGVLSEPAGGVQHAESGLKWPLTITKAAVERIRRESFRAGLPALQRVEQFFSDVLSAYPNTLRAFFWLTLGGGLVKLLDLALG